MIKMKHEIEIPDLPDGWEPVAYRLGDPDEPYYDPATKSICRLLLSSSVGVMIVRKKQPRRIVFEETDIKNAKIAFFDDAGMWTYWKIVEDNKCAE